jgi:2'-5' RNA ligase
MRLFVAAYPPTGVLDDLSALVGTLAVGQPREPGQSVRLVPPERWHLTLAFLGDVPDEREPAACAALGAAAERWAERREPAPQVWLGGGGRFGSGRFTTLWTGIRGDTTPLRDLVSDVRGELRRAKLPFDAKTFRAHLTLARPADRLTADQLAADLAALARYEGPKWTVQAVELVRSHLGPNVRYDRLLAVPLPDPAAATGPVPATASAPGARTDAPYETRRRRDHRPPARRRS